MIKQTVLSLIGVTIIGSMVHAADAPEIIDVSSEEICGSFNGVRPSIDIDSAGQPHIVVDSGHAALGNTLMMYNKIGGRWSGRTFATRTSEGYSPSAISQPWVEIDAKDRMWVFAQFFQAGVMANSGQGVWLYRNMTSYPIKSWFHKKQYGQYGWGPGNVSIDPLYPDEAVIMTINGDWGKVNSAGTTIGTGRMGPVLSGEKFRFRIAPDPTGKTRGIWHGVMNGSSARHSSYRNSKMTADAVWASHSPYYPSQGDDHNHAGVCGDLQNPEIGYMAAVYEDGGTHNGLQFNVWRGNALRFAYPSQQLGRLDDHATFIHRYAPALTPAHGDTGGCWAAWGNEHGEIWIAYINQAGTVVSKEHVANGFTCAINTDKDGNIHMAYNSGGLVRYRKLKVSGGATLVMNYQMLTAGNYDTNNPLDELAVWRPQNGNWYFKDLSSNENVTADSPIQFGGPAAIPVPADYDNDGREDIAVWYPGTGKWYIRRWSDGTLLGGSGLQFGGAAAIPVPANYITNSLGGVGRSEPAVYYPNSGNWYIRDWITGKASAGSPIQFGGPGTIPVPGNYDTNTVQDEIAVYRPSTAEWFIRDWVTGKATADSPIQFGGPAAIPVPADYNNDGRTDLAVWFPGTGRWYIRMWDGTLLDGDSQALGDFDSIPVPGNYIPHASGSGAIGRVEPAVYSYDNGNWNVYDWYTHQEHVDSPVQFGGNTFSPPHYYLRVISAQPNHPALWDNWDPKVYGIMHELTED